MDHRIAALGLVVAQHYRLLKAKVAESKSKGGVQLLSAEEARLADYLGDTIEGMAGKTIGNYCRTQFRRGWLTLDLRAYKIKFVLTKLRDILPEGRTKDELVSSLDLYVSPAEFMAGCTADGKRRNRAAREEQERLVRQRREERAAMKAAGKRAQRGSDSSSQMEFESILAEVDSGSSPSDPSEDSTKKEQVQAEKAAKGKRRAPRKPRKMSIEKLADEITAREYGDHGESPEDKETDDEVQGVDEDYGFEDREYIRDNLCSHYERGFSSVCRYGDADRLEGTGGEYEWDPNND